jgi:hypothetical protein
MATEKTLGVATNKARIELGTISGATIDDCVIGGTTAVAGTFTALTATGNVALGDAAADTIGLYGVTAVSQRASSTQATSLLSAASSTAIDSLTKAAIIEIMETLKAVGIWKGSV